MHLNVSSAKWRLSRLCLDVLSGCYFVILYFYYICTSLVSRGILLMAKRMSTPECWQILTDTFLHTFRQIYCNNAHFQPKRYTDGITMKNDGAEDNIFKCLCWIGNIWISKKVSSYAFKDPIDKTPGLVQILVWCQTNDRDHCLNQCWPWWPWWPHQIETF